MRIRILGNTDSAIAIRGMLNQDPTVVVSDEGYLYTVEIIDSDSKYPTVDGVDSEWERKLINRISDLAATNILLLRHGGIQSDQHIRIGIPDGSLSSTVERGIFQAVLQMASLPPANVIKVANALKSEMVALLEEARELASMKPEPPPLPPQASWLAKVKSWFA